MTENRAFLLLSAAGEVAKTIPLLGFLRRWFTRMSSVAGILDVGGGFRVVVTSRWRIRFHVQKWERAFIAPRLLVEEPVPWDRMPAVIEAGRRAVLDGLAPNNKCGECKECCITPYIKTQDFTKPSHQACHNCAHTKTGCAIYWNRPLQCQEFKCLWLKSQSTDRPMPPELRPDKALVILTGPELPDEPYDKIYIHPQHKVSRDTNSCRMSERMAAWLAASGRSQMIVTHYHGEDK